jgi:calpain-15
MQDILRRIEELSKVPDYNEIIAMAKKERLDMANPIKCRQIKRPTTARNSYKFVDQQFKPKLDTIFCLSHAKFSLEKRQKWVKRIEWRRIQDIYPKNEIRIVEDVQLADVEQGDIGDCYFMSALSSLASQQPNEIAKLFITSEYNDAGCYAMRLLVNGYPQVIVVDDYIPYDKITKCPVFAGKKTKNIWPMLLEKAWAKINGSYEGISTGSACEALKNLIPYPIEKLKYNKTKEEVRELWRKLNDAMAGQYLVTCASGEGDVERSETEFDKLGLTRNHSFTISGVYEFKHEGKSMRLLKISNPWNKQEWKGKWADQDKIWTPDIMKKVEFDKKAPGEFFISLGDFCEYFDSTTICKLDSFLDHSSLKLSHKKGSY